MVGHGRERSLRRILLARRRPPADIELRQHGRWRPWRRPAFLARRRDHLPLWVTRTGRRMATALRRRDCGGCGGPQPVFTAVGRPATPGRWCLRRVWAGSACAQHDLSRCWRVCGGRQERTAREQRNLPLKRGKIVNSAGGSMERHRKVLHRHAATSELHGLTGQ